MFCLPDMHTVLGILCTHLTAAGRPDNRQRRGKPRKGAGSAPPAPVWTALEPSLGPWGWDPGCRDLPQASFHAWKSS